MLSKRRPTFRRIAASPPRATQHAHPGARRWFGWPALCGGALLVACQTNTAPQAEPVPGKGHAAESSLQAGIGAAADGLDQLSKEQLVKQLIEVSQSRKMAETALENMKQQLTAIVEQSTADQNRSEAEVEAARKTVADKLAAIDWDGLVTELEQGMVPIYSKHFSEAELIDIVRFYQSGSGKALIERMPKIMQEIMPMGQQWAMKQMQKLQADLQQSLQNPQSLQK